MPCIFGTQMLWAFRALQVDRANCGVSQMCVISKVSRARSPHCVFCFNLHLTFHGPCDPASIHPQKGQPYFSYCTGTILLFDRPLESLYTWLTFLRRDDVLSNFGAIPFNLFFEVRERRAWWLSVSVACITDLQREPTERAMKFFFNQKMCLIISSQSISLQRAWKPTPKCGVGKA